jgi:flagellar biosynthesis protein FlhA
VVDPASVLIPHLGEVLRYHAHELLTREALKQMLDRVQQFAPTVIEEIKPETIRMGTLHQTLCQLAESQIPLSDLALVLESIVNHAPGHDDVNSLTDHVRIDLGRLVCERFRDGEGRLRAITMEPKLDSFIRQSMHDGQLAISPTVLGRLIEASARAWSDSERRQQPLALLVDQKLRRAMTKLLARSARDLGIVAYQEIPSDMIIDSVVTLQFDDIVQQDPTQTAAAVANHQEAA